MKKRLLLAAIFLAFASCSTNTVAPIAGYSSSKTSSSGGTSGGSSGGSNSSTSSSSYTALPTVDSSFVAGPTDLKVSTFVDSTTMVLTWTDIPSLKQSEYSGYKVYRNDNYSGWVAVGSSPPDQQFYRDRSYKSMQYIADYRIIAFVKTSTGDSLISKWSNEAGVVAVNQLAFGAVTFETVDSVGITRWSPSTFEMRWHVSNKKPEVGFVIQHMNSLPDTALFPDSTSITKVPVAPGDWRNVDTLGQDDNHYTIHMKNKLFPSLFRLYAYYNNEFKTMISEFSPEVLTPRAYDASISFTPPAVYTKVLDDTTIDVSWNPTDLNVGIVAGDTVWYEYQETVGATPTPAKDPTVDRHTTAHRKNVSAITDLCSYSIRVRMAWLDSWGAIDYSAWSPLSGTKPGTDGTLTDNNKICKK